MNEGQLLAVMCLTRDQEMRLHYMWMNEHFGGRNDTYYRHLGAAEVFWHTHECRERLHLGFYTMEEAIAFKLKYL